MVAAAGTAVVAAVRTLERWLEQPATPARLESDGLVKIFLAPSSSKSTLLGHLADLREEAATRQAELRAILGPYLDGDGPFPDRLHVTVLGARLILDQAQAQINWAAWAIAEVERWPDTKTPDDREHSRRLLAKTLERPV